MVRAGRRRRRRRSIDYQLNENGALVDYGDQPADYKTDVFTDQAVDFVDRAAPRRSPSSSGSPTRPRTPAGRTRVPAPRRLLATPKPAPRHAAALRRGAAAAPPSFNEADVSDKPLSDRQPRADADRAAIADSTRRYRCRLESLLAVDEGVGRIVAALRAAGELDDTLIVFTSDNGFFPASTGSRPARTASTRRRSGCRC